MVLRLADVTMLEAVGALRENRLYIQFERERLDNNEDIDRSRAIADSRRRFGVSLDMKQRTTQVLDAVTLADPHYDWVALTREPESYFVFPRGERKWRFAASMLAWELGPVRTFGRPLVELLTRELGLAEHGVVLFDRAGFLDQVAVAPSIRTRGRRFYRVLGELFAGCGLELTWTLGGIGRPRALSIGCLPPR